MWLPPGKSPDPRAHTATAADKVEPEVQAWTPQYWRDTPSALLVHEAMMLEAEPYPDDSGLPWPQLFGEELQHDVWAGSWQGEKHLTGQQ